MIGYLQIISSFLSAITLRPTISALFIGEEAGHPKQNVCKL